MKAQYLGSTINTILIRCACGARVYADREAWKAAGFVPCEACGRQINLDLTVSRPAASGHVAR